MSIKNYSFEEMEASALNIVDEESENISPNDEVSSIYKLDDELIKKGNQYDSTGVYFQYSYRHENNPDTRDIYLKIERNFDKKCEIIYTWVSNENDSFNNLAIFRRDKLPIEEEIEEGGKSSINKKLSHTGRNIANVDSADDVFKSFFKEIVLAISNSSNLRVFKELDYELPEDMDDEEIDENEIESLIEARKNPILDDEMKSHALSVENKIKEKGLISYYDSFLDKIHIGKHNNIYRKHLGAFNVIRGKGSYLFGALAKSGEGKSLEDEITFLIMIPQEYIFKRNQMTLSSFSRYSKESIYFFDRMIIYFGDLGGRKSFEKLEDVFDMVKTLITENEFSRDLSDGSSKGGYENVTLTLSVDSFGGVYQTINEDFYKGDGQLESRSIQSTPFDVNEDELLDFLFALNMDDSIENQEKEKALLEVDKYHCYLKSLINKDIKIINPYRSFFKKLVKHSDIVTRDFKQLLQLFDAYCVLTYFKCNNHNGKLIASQNQLNEFISNVCLDNTLPQIESDFIKMLMGKNTKKELVLFDVESEDTLNDLTEYYNNVFEELNNGSLDEYGYTTFDDLDYNKRPMAIAKLLEMYRLDGKGLNHRGNVFFTISDVKRAYSSRKAFKNISNLGNFLNKLYNKGFLEKLDFYDSKGNNIYYLTSKCEEISKPIELDENDIIDANNFLANQGIYEK